MGGGFARRAESGDDAGRGRSRARMGGHPWWEEARWAPARPPRMGRTAGSARMSKWTPFQHRPTVLHVDPLLTKLCRKCNAEFQTQSRVKKRCDACQAAREAVRRKTRAGQ